MITKILQFLCPHRVTFIIKFKDGERLPPAKQYFECQACFKNMGTMGCTFGEDTPHWQGRIYGEIIE